MDKVSGVKDSLGGLLGNRENMKWVACAIAIVVLLIGLWRCGSFVPSNPASTEEPGAQNVVEVTPTIEAPVEQPAETGDHGWNLITQTEDDNWDVDEGALGAMMEMAQLPRGMNFSVILSPHQNDQCVRKNDLAYISYVHLGGFDDPKRDLDHPIASCAVWARMRSEFEKQGTYSGMSEEVLTAKRLAAMGEAITYASQYEVVVQK